MEVDTTKSENSSFVRWQEIRIKQFGDVNNLLVGLSSGIIAFELPSLYEHADKLTIWEARLALASLLLLSGSLIVGVFIAWNRLKDFKKTARTARLREKHNRDQEELKNLRKETTWLGNLSWCLLRIQGILFTVGILILLLTVFLYLYPFAINETGSHGPAREQLEQTHTNH